MSATTRLIVASSLLLLSTACGGKDKPEPKTGPGPTGTPAAEDSYNYANPDFPDHFRVESEGFHMQVPLLDSDNTPADNPTTNAGAALGRVLFYDENLSQNRTISCGSCHKQSTGFSDDRVLSIGFEGGSTKRHSMGLTNARFYQQGMFFWDQRAATLEDQVLMPFQDPVEMGMTLESLENRAQAADYYPALFEAAFGDDGITSERIARALAQFVRSMASYQSKYDEGRAMVNRRSDPFPNFTEQENRGKVLFVSPPPMGGFGCFACHQGEGFIAQRAVTNGLDANTAGDRGYGAISGFANDEGTFKTPSLRNVALRAPYMHDGRFATLHDVIDHYSDGVQPSPNVGPPLLRRGGQIRMSVQDKTAVKAFLETLTDASFTNDPKFSDPFK
ncbi:MAG: cytochrome c peroxidase [Hyphomicrobium sp.]